MDIGTVVTQTEQRVNEDPAACIGRERRAQTDELPSTPTVCIGGRWSIIVCFGTSTGVFLPYVFLHVCGGRIDVPTVHPFETELAGRM